MTISSYQVHNVIRTYGKQLKRGLRLNKTGSSGSGESVDKVNISAEAKRNLVVERVATEIMNALASQGRDASNMTEEVISSLSDEYGQPLEATFDKSTGQFQFQALDPQTGQVQKNLDKEDSDRLNARLTKLTEEIVDRNMLKG
ncbi:MAG: hypothetical protein HQK55_15285 [Deltaproteobacteria bacterium]|nr:hypothetical protein [Deltaproteobacteria bacterium]